MAGRYRGARGLVLGLVLGAIGAAALSSISTAEPRAGARTAQAAPPIANRPEQPRPKARKLARDTVAVDEGRTDQVESIARTQRCLAELGYYKGEIDGKRGAETWTAYWHFKSAHGLKSQGDLLSKAVQQKLASLCKNLDQAITSTPAPPPIDTTAAYTEIVPLVLDEDGAAAPAPRARLDLDCLPDDLLNLLRASHGRAGAAKPCAPSCLASPKGFSQPLLDELQSRNGVVWCRTCVPIEGHLALADVRRIERAGKIDLCVMASRQLPHQGRVAGGSAYTRIREVYRELAPQPPNPGAIAVVIGNRHYSKLPASENSANDAGAFYSLLTEHLGYSQDNVIDLRDVKKDDLKNLFGATPGAEGDLARLVRSAPSAELLVYYSGRGATDIAQSEVYLLPVDSEPYREQQSGYKLSTLYENLTQLGAKSVLVLLEAEYGRDHGAYVMPPNLPDSIRTALPPKPMPGLTVLAASDRGQRTLVDPAYDMGLFTRYLIEGLAGKADLPPVGNGDGKIDSAEIYVYAAAMVRLAARKSFGLLQNPLYSSTATPVLARAPQAAPVPQAASPVEGVIKASGPEAPVLDHGRVDAKR